MGRVPALHVAGASLAQLGDDRRRIAPLDAGPITKRRLFAEAKLAGERLTCLVLVGSTCTTAPRPQLAPMKSWRRLPTDEEKRAAHPSGDMNVPTSNKPIAA